MTAKSWIVLALVALPVSVVVVLFLNRPDPELSIRLNDVERWPRPEQAAPLWIERAKVFVQRAENGPLRCSLRARRGAPELEMSLTNTSTEPIKFRSRNYFHDDFIFILRDEDEQIVNAASRYWLESSHRNKFIELGPNETKSDRLELRFAIYDFIPARPGVYSLEAVFSEEHPTELFGWERGMHARSNRVPLHVRQ